MLSEVKSAVDQWRQKGKDKDRERNKKLRKEEFKRALLVVRLYGRFKTLIDTI